MWHNMANEYDLDSDIAIEYSAKPMGQGYWFYNAMFLQGYGFTALFVYSAIFYSTKAYKTKAHSTKANSTRASQHCV